MNNPANYVPKCPDDLLGKPAQIAAAILSNLAEVKHAQDTTFKLLLHGPPGNGKTTIANLASACLATSKFDIESINGRNLTIDTVRDWQKNACYGSLFGGGWKVKVINECDLVPVAAQDLMLTYLDELPPRTAVIATSNEDAAALTARFQSRFQTVRVPTPSGAEIAAWLKSKFALAETAANWIGEQACGNVRQALLEAASFLMTGELPTQLQTKGAGGKDATMVAAGMKAWEARQRNAQTRNALDNCMQKPA